ncbi:MAG: aminotransferase class I/II-fold pyridoxal phosphate-dependent enzyme [Tissierellia bacterium]|nr:aminotransferase class I/II-fold pyridoxal phosphate-dependent enzyme [Tissierellia bacterium]
MDHGGDLLTYEHHYDGELIDFSSNINPLGPPKGLDEILINSFKSLESYPDIQYRKLKISISKYLQCNSKNVLVGNGAVEIINNFIIPANRVIVMTPAFSEYEKRAIAHGKEVVKLKYNDDFSIDLHKLNTILKEEDLLILGNPNNPTGLRIEKHVLLQIYNLVKNKNAYLLLDEAFYEFAPPDYDSIEIFKRNDYKSLGIIRAATKFFALPGIRLGYGCASSLKVEEISKIELPWSINALADIAGQFIFKDKDYINESKDYIEVQRDFLMDRLRKLNNIKVYETHTNYILIKLEKWDEDYLFNHFLKHGIVIRKCSSFKELGNNHIRIAIKNRENNLKLINIFKKIK